MDLTASVRDYWNTDAATYDHGRGHDHAGPAERAAWTAAVEAALPSAPGRVLDVGAGTGFVSMMAARLGHQVTALDLSPEMLGRLSERATNAGLAVQTVEGTADDPPPGPFDAVLERHVLWTMPDPGAALTAWRRAAPEGVLVLFESLWGQADPGQAMRIRARGMLASLRRQQSDHHAPYPQEVLDELPLGKGTPPGRVVELVEAAGWLAPTLRRLTDVEWARMLAMPPYERVLGAPVPFVVTAR